MEETQENAALLILQAVTHQEITGFVGKIGARIQGKPWSQNLPSRANFLNLLHYVETMNS